MRKRLINIYILCVLVCCIYGCAKTDKENLVAEMETVGTRHMETEDANRADIGHAESESEETAISGEEYDQSGEDVIPTESVDDQGPMPDEIKASAMGQRQAEIFYQVAEEGYGLSHEEAQGWFDSVREDDVFEGGTGEIRDLIFDDIDDNGETDMIIMVQKPEEEFMPGTGAVYFYMNTGEPYCFADENFPFFRPMNICYADFNGDGNVEIAFALKGTGNSGVGDWYKAMLSYTGNTMKRLEFPSDFKPDYSDGAEIGLTVDVNMEPEPDTYTAYCPYLDESIIFHASNYWEEDDRQAALARDPLRGGCNCRGYFYLQAVTWEGRDALQVREYLYGEGGPSHFVGWACFILIWDEQGNGSVADWWIEEEFDEWWEVLLKSDILPNSGH